VAYKTYSNLPAHTGLTIQFYAIFIDGWQGESYLVYADGFLVYSQSNYGTSAHSYEVGRLGGGAWEATEESRD
jgi:hypothetical protein